MRQSKLGKDPRNNGRRIRRIICYYCRVMDQHEKCWERDWQVVCLCPCHTLVQVVGEDGKARDVRKWEGKELKQEVAKKTKKMIERGEMWGDADEGEYTRESNAIDASGINLEDSQIFSTVLDARECAITLHVDPKRLRTILRKRSNELGATQDESGRWRIPVEALELLKALV